MFLLLFLKINFIRVELIYSAVLISLLLFLVLLRPAPRTPHPQAWLQAVDSRPACPAAPEAPAPCPPRSRKAWGGATARHVGGGWVFGSRSPSCPVFPLLDGEQRACELSASPASSVGPGWALGAALCYRGDCLSGGGAVQPWAGLPSGRRVLSPVLRLWPRPVPFTLLRQEKVPGLFTLGVVFQRSLLTWVGFH